MKGLLIIGIVIVIVLACENGCSGHGTCGNGEKCDCFPGWGGSCPYGEAFVDILPGDLDHDGSITTDKGSSDKFHAVKTEWSPVSGTAESIGMIIKETKRAHRYAECSNAGICNRVTGLCNCNSGFEGSACQRRSCPTSSEGLVCNGHGMCMSSEESIIHKGLQAATSSISLPSGWEFQKFGVCVCDKGWTGISCGSRVCPKGLDPMKVGKVEYRFSVTASNILDNGNYINHYYEMIYDGIKYTTPIIPARTGVCANGKVTNVGIEAAEDIRRAIASIPPLSQSKVSITCDTNGIKTIDITTPYIELDLSGNSCTGNSPCTIGIGIGSGTMTDSKIKSFIAYKEGDRSSKDEIKSLTVSVSGDITKVTADSFISCSGRGLCDTTNGLCQCFDGYSGLACDKTRNQ